MDNNQNIEPDLKRATIYVSDALLKEMDEFNKKHGFGTRSAMLRIAFTVFKHVIETPQKSNEIEINHSEQLNRIEILLKEIQVQIKLIDTSNIASFLANQMQKTNSNL
jgi:hypothetical protein